jgi:hypothetical protein
MDDAPIKTENEKRPFWRKIPGFRSGKWWKRAIAIVGYFFIILFIAAAIDISNDPPVTKTADITNPQAANSTVTEPQPIATEALAAPADPTVNDSGVTAAQKAEILEFEKQIYATEKIASSAMEAYSAKATDMGNGNASIYDVYSAASMAKDRCKEVQFAMSKIKTPDVPKEISTLLVDVKMDLSTGYMIKAEALDSAMKFLDNQKPSDMQNFKDKIKRSDSLIMGAVVKLMQAKEKAGINNATN